MNWFRSMKRRRWTSALSHCPQQQICSHIVAIVTIGCCTYENALLSIWKSIHICVDYNFSEHPITYISIEHIAWPKLLSYRTWLTGRDWSTTIESVWIKREGSQSVCSILRRNPQTVIKQPSQITLEINEYSDVRLSRLPTLSYENRWYKESCLWYWAGWPYPETSAKQIQMDESLYICVSF